MQPRPFAYHRPGAIAEVFELLDRYGEDSSLYGGGTELFLALKMRLLHFEHLIDLKRIDGLTGIAVSDNGLEIGAMTTHQAIATDASVERICPALRDLCGNIANARVRSVGTIGGNLCFADPRADPPILLSALGAKLILVGPAGQRTVPVADFIVSEYETDRRPNEILTRIVVPRTDAIATFRWVRHGDRSLAGVAAVVEFDKARAATRSCRIWAGAYGPRPVSLAAVESNLTGVATEAIERALDEGIEDAVASLDVIEDHHGGADHKRHLVAILVRRALLSAIATPAP